MYESVCAFVAEGFFNSFIFLIYTLFLVYQQYSSKFNFFFDIFIPIQALNPLELVYW